MASIRKRKWKHAGQEHTCWVIDYHDQGGVRRQRSFPTKTAATAWSTTALKEVVDGTHTADRASITVAAAAQVWLKGRRLDGRERATIEDYERHIRLHLEPRLGATKLSRLTAGAVERFRDELLGSLSRPMALAVLRSLRMLIADAQRRGKVAQNVAAAVRLKARSRDESKIHAGHEYPSPDEVRRILEAAPAAWRPLFVTAAFTGLRASELRGLAWADVDLQRATLRVHRRADRYGVLGSPKSKAAYREVPLPPTALATLRAWKLVCPRLPARDGEPAGRLGLVFPNRGGRPQELTNILRRGFHPTQVAADVTAPVVDENGQPVLDPKGRPRVRAKFGMHALRHAAISWWISCGFAPKKVQAMAGHSSITMTFDTYGHLWPNLQDDLDKLSAGEASFLAPCDNGATRPEKTPENSAFPPSS